jgi:hypothetical protein
MLRVFKPTSPLSVGSFILAPFASLSGAALASHLTGRLPRVGRLAGAGAAAFGPPLATYTAALLGNTVVPAWHEAHRELPFVFAGSGAAAAGGLAMLLAPRQQSGPAVRMALAGTVLEGAAMQLIERRRGLSAEPYQRGKPGRLMRTAKALSVGATAVTVVAGRSRTGRAVAGAAYVAGSVALRFGIFEAGLDSARDPKYTVVPQRQRVDERRRAKMDA